VWNFRIGCEFSREEDPTIESPNPSSYNSKLDAGSVQRNIPLLQLKYRVRERERERERTCRNWSGRKNENRNPKACLGFYPLVFFFFFFFFFFFLLSLLEGFEESELKLRFDLEPDSTRSLIVYNKLGSSRISNR